jgi:hypothetical protein
VLVGHEQFGHMRSAFRRRGFDAWSCDLMPARDGSPFHLQCDVMDVLDDQWDMAIFHPDCTFLTCSAAWAYGDGPYHQKLKTGTLVGADRRRARDEALAHVYALRDCRIPLKAIENPVGVLSSHWRKPDQIVHPHWFGEDASKATCWWLEGGLPELTPTAPVEPRMVAGRPRWGNQTGSGQNKLTPSPDRAMLRAETCVGMAEACAEQWGDYLIGWRRVTFAADCDEDGNCPVCGIDYADCDCPGPTQDGFDYRERDGELWARKSPP